MNNDRPDISVVIPFFNENPGAEDTLREWTAFLGDEIPNYEIVAINDGSLDGTGRILDRLRHENPKIRVFHQLHTGHSQALRRGYEAARGEYIMQADAGGRFETIDARRLWDERGGNYLVLGVRTHRLDGLIRRSYSWVLKLLLQTFLGVRLQDANIPFRLFERERGMLILKPIASKPALNLLLAVHFALEAPSRVKEIPVPYRPRKSGRRPVHLLGTSVFALAALRELLGLAGARLTYRYNYVLSEQN